MSETRLRIVTPIVTADFGHDVMQDLVAALRPTTRLDMVSIDTGPSSIETELADRPVLPELRRVFVVPEQEVDLVLRQ